MNSNNEFDELARQKLAERSFPFEEANWQAVQTDLARQGQSERGWWYGGILLLLLGASGLWLLSGTTQDGTADQTLANAEQQSAIPAEREQSAPLAEAQKSPASDPLEKVTEHQQAEALELQELRISERMNDSKVLNASIPKAVNSERTKAEVLDLNELHASENVKGAIIHNASLPNSATSQASLVPATAKERDRVSAVPSAQPTATRPSSSTAFVNGTENSLESANATATNPNEEADTDLAENLNAAADLVATGNAAALIDHTRPSGTAPVAKDLSPEQDLNVMPGMPEAEQLTERTTLPELPTVETAETAAQDTIGPQKSPNEESLLVTQVPHANDSSDTALLEPILLAVGTKPSPWEISAVGGLFNSQAQFRGGTSEDWNANSTAQRSIAAGMELMHMGRNTGIGLGLFYGSHAERIAVGDISNTLIDVERFWFLRSVDTTLLFVSDTVDFNGDPYYVGDPVTTTVNVLTQGFDTTITTTQQRAARSIQNRVSYVEIPLLLDAHLVQGRWSLGVRGGPSIGLLTGRSGALPNTSNDGYTTFEDQAFSSVVLGYTARAYVRYRWNAAWSVGLEPTIRGQLGNSLGDAPLERRSSAMGAMLSLSYRLP